MSTVIEALNILNTIVDNDSNFSEAFESDDPNTISDIAENEFPAVLLIPYSEKPKDIASGWVTGNPKIDVRCEFPIGSSNVKTTRRASIPLADTLFASIKNYKFSTMDEVRFGLNIINSEVVEIACIFEYNK